MTKTKNIINWIKNNINSISLFGFGIGWPANKDKTNFSGKNVLDVKECAEYIKFTEEEIIKYLESGELEGIKIHNKWRIQYNELIKFLDEQKRKTSLNVLFNELCNPESWEKALEEDKELKKEIESSNYPENTFGKWLQDIIKSRS